LGVAPIPVPPLRSFLHGNKATPRAQLWQSPCGGFGPLKRAENSGAAAILSVSLLYMIGFRGAPPGYFVQITVWNSLVMEAARMEFERANLEIDGPIAILRMNDPDVLNALSPGMIKGMSDSLDFLAAAETPVRCLVLTGTGRAFSTGANLQ